MTQIFADTSFFIGLIDRDDQLHGSATEFLTSNRSPLLTTSAIVLELGAFFSDAPLRSFFMATMDAITRAMVEVIHVDPSLQQRGVDLFKSRMDKNWSLTDCISFALMSDGGIHEAASADEHFEQAGFIAVLRDPPNPRHTA